MTTKEPSEGTENNGASPLKRGDTVVINTSQWPAKGRSVQQGIEERGDDGQVRTHLSIKGYSRTLMAV
jgi:hypothetical protein